MMQFLHDSLKNKMRDNNGYRLVAAVRLLCYLLSPQDDNIKNSLFVYMIHLLDKDARYSKYVRSVVGDPLLSEAFSLRLLDSSILALSSEKSLSSWKTIRRRVIAASAILEFKIRRDAYPFYGDKDASLNKSWRFIEELRNPELSGYSHRSKILSSWQEYKYSSHLCFGFVKIYRKIIDLEEINEDIMMNLMSELKDASHLKRLYGIMIAAEPYAYKAVHPGDDYRKYSKTRASSIIQYRNALDALLEPDDDDSFVTNLRPSGWTGGFLFIPDVPPAALELEPFNERELSIQAAYRAEK